MSISRFVFLCFFALMLLGCEKNADTPNSATTPALESTATPMPGQTGEGKVESPETAVSGTKTEVKEKPPAYAAEPEEFVVDRAGAEESVAKAQAERASGNYEKAAKAYADAMVLDPQNVKIPYESARNFANWGKNDLAIESLGVAADLGYSDVQAVVSQSDFDPLRENPRFTKIVSRIEANR